MSSKSRNLFIEYQLANVSGWRRITVYTFLSEKSEWKINMREVEAIEQWRLKRQPKKANKEAGLWV